MKMMRVERTLVNDSLCSKEIIGLKEKVAIASLNGLLGRSGLKPAKNRIVCVWFGC